MKLFLAAAMYLIGVPCFAQNVYKCVNGKDVSYQSAPCTTAQKELKQWDAVPEAPPTNQELWRRHYAKQKRDRESAYLRSLATRTRSGPTGASIQVSGSNGCEAAKGRRQQALDAAGMNRSFDMLRSLDDAVYRACK